jgi:steroid delta-isomerase-like uncharacterized protein
MTTLLTEAHSADKRVEIAREQVDAFNRGDWELLRGTLTSDSRYDELGTERKVEGSEKIIELFKGWKQAFPDAAGTVTSAFSNGVKAFLGVTWKGTHTGAVTTAEGMIPASGKHQQTPAAIVFAFEGDKVKESRHYFDSLTLLDQIDAQPNLRPSH